MAADWLDDNDNADALSLDFNVEDIDTTKGAAFEPLPAGTYSAIVSAIKPTTTKDGQSLQMVAELTITQEGYAGRKLWARHSVKTSRTDEGMAKSVEIGRRQLAEMAKALGVTGSNLAPCIGGELQVKVKVRPGANGYDASNDVVAYRALEGATATEAAPAAKAAAPQAPKPAGGKPAFMARKG